MRGKVWDKIQKKRAKALSIKNKAVILRPLIRVISTFKSLLIKKTKQKNGNKNQIAASRT